MCVIMSCGPTVPPPPKAHLEAANEHNPHGWGVSINVPRACEQHQDGSGVVLTCKKCRKASELITRRGFSTDLLLLSVREQQELRDARPGSSMVIHARIATGTPVNLGNTHPFYVTGKLTLFHNGIFPTTMIPVTNPVKPDSWHLARMLEPVMSKVPEHFTSAVFATWLDDVCVRASSKVALLDALLGVQLYNTKAWVDGEEGRLYSNSTPMNDWGFGSYPGTYLTGRQSADYYGFLDAWEEPEKRYYLPKGSRVSYFNEHGELEKRIDDICTAGVDEDVDLEGFEDDRSDCPPTWLSEARERRDKKRLAAVAKTASDVQTLVEGRLRDGRTIDEVVDELATARGLS